MKRYAFIDVQNTETTTTKLLGFAIDWYKMYEYLKERWECEKIFFYSGFSQGNEEVRTEYERLSALGYIVQAKPYFIYKNPDQIITIVCPTCKTEIIHTIKKGPKWKSNCDVEFSVDATTYIANDVEYLFFTGDGDFEYLTRCAIEKGVNVYIISSAMKIKISNRYFTSRFSSKLRALIAEKRDQIFFIDINDWKLKIEKKENAVQAGVF
jgi:uncharacterized LabA/DUF88 family protein